MVGTRDSEVAGLTAVVAAAGTGCDVALLTDVEEVQRDVDESVPRCHGSAKGVGERKGVHVVIGAVRRTVYEETVVRHALTSELRVGFTQLSVEVGEEGELSH